MIIEERYVDLSRIKYIYYADGGVQGMVIEYYGDIERDKTIKMSKEKYIEYLRAIMAEKR